MKQPITLTGEVEVPGTDAISARLDDQASNINAIDAQLGTLLMRTFTPEQFGGKPGTESTKALQSAFDAAAKSGGEVYLSPGTWRGNVEVKNVYGMTIRGDSMSRTLLVGTKPNTPALSIKGCWYSTIRDLGFGVDAGVNCGVLEIDRGDERGVQGNTFQSIYVNGQGLEDGKKSKYAMSMCRVGNALGAAGAQGSEQLFLNCHFSGATQACYYQVGFNALNNTFVGGNFQNYDRCGMELTAGAVQIFSVAFQSTVGYAQIDNGGWDIKMCDGGTSDGIVIAGCRTESLRFLKSASSQRPSVIGCLQMATADPKKPAFNVVEVETGAISNCYWTAGNVVWGKDTDNQGNEVTGDYTCKPSDRWVLVNADKDAMVRLCDATTVPVGTIVTIVRAGGSKGEVCVYGPLFDNVPVHQLRLVDSMQFIAIGGRTTSTRWYKVK